MPFTGFWDRWRRRQLQQHPTAAAKPPSLGQAEQQRALAARQVTESLAAIAAANANKRRHGLRHAGSDSCDNEP